MFRWRDSQRKERRGWGLLPPVWIYSFGREGCLEFEGDEPAEELMTIGEGKNLCFLLGFLRK
jgi:hypothetical protein